MLRHEAAAGRDLIGLFRMLQPWQGCEHNHHCPPRNRPGRSQGCHGLLARDPPAHPCPCTCAAGLPAALGAGVKVSCTVPTGGHRSPCRLLLVLRGLDGFQPPRVLVALIVGFCLVLGRRDGDGRISAVAGRTQGVWVKGSAPGRGRSDTFPVQPPPLVTFIPRATLEVVFLAGCSTKLLSSSRQTALHTNVFRPRYHFAKTSPHCTAEIRTLL